MASWRITTKSADALFSASIFAAWSSVSEARGLIQSAAATIGEISQPVGSTAWAAGMTAVGGDVVDVSPRHFANSRSRLEKLPVAPALDFVERMPAAGAPRLPTTPQIVLKVIWRTRLWRDRVSLCGRGQSDPLGDAAPVEPCSLCNLADGHPLLVEVADMVKGVLPRTTMPMPNEMSMLRDLLSAAWATNVGRAVLVLAV